MPPASSSTIPGLKCFACDNRRKHGASRLSLRKQLRVGTRGASWLAGSSYVSNYVCEHRHRLANLARLGALYACFFLSRLEKTAQGFHQFASHGQPFYGSLYYNINFT